MGSYYIGGEIVVSDDETAKRRQEEPQAIVDRLHSLYEQKKPFFSQSVFHEIVRQLDECSARPRSPTYEDNSDEAENQVPVISIPAIDGSVVRTRLQTGLTMPGDKKNTEFALMNPILCYRPYRELCEGILKSYLDPEWAYCPARLLYPMQRRRIPTGRLLDMCKREDPEAVRSAFETGVQQWQDSAECRLLRELLEGALPPRINKIVAFACATMTTKSQQLRSVAQHALVLTLLDILRQRQQQDESEDQRLPEVQCFAQDPSYTDTDKENLERVGVTVVEDPRGFMQVDDQTVVVSIWPNIPVRQIIADIARPAALIWDRVRGEAKHRCTDPESRRVWAMVQNHYDAVTTLEPEDKFGDTVVYIRQVP